MSEIEMDDLEKLSAQEIFKMLTRLWNDEIEDVSENFTNDTGGDLEQCLVELLTDMKYILNFKKITNFMS